MKYKASLKSRALFWQLKNFQSFTQFLESWSSQRPCEYIRQLIFTFAVGDVNFLLFLRQDFKIKLKIDVKRSIKFGEC